MSQHKVGSRVTWTSQAGGSTKEKTGTVVAVIAGGRGSGDRATQEIRSRVKAGTHRSAFGGGWDREGESYLVEVPQGTSGKARPVLYWPVANRLKRA